MRNAVEAAAKAGPGWAKRTAYNRGQILYRLGEMLEARKEEMTEALLLGQRSREQAAKAVASAIDRLIYYAGWADKYEQVLGNVNPVASPHFNFTVAEPVGVVGLIAPDECPLLALLSLVAPAIVSGNTVVALAAEAAPLPSILLGEMLAVSDLPGGVVNLLTGHRRELVPAFATHAHIRALSAVVPAADRRTLRLGAAETVRRVHASDPAGVDWFSDAAQGVGPVADLVEFKTTWHPIGS